MPDQVLTDNGKAFTGRFGVGTGEVNFDRTCRENGIKHLLAAPRRPPPARWSASTRPVRSEFLTGKVFASIEDAQAALDAWAIHYNHERPHESSP